jgi:hypothetical protein
MVAFDRRSVATFPFPPRFPLPSSSTSHAGKTTVIDTVAAELPGVVRVRVVVGASEDKIVNKTLKAITRFQFTFVDPFISGSTRVVYWHRKFFGVPPTVILHVGERTPGKEPAPMGSTVRTLVDDHKLRVIVDSSDSSLDLMALKTKRQDVLQVRTKRFVSPPFYFSPTSHFVLHIYRRWAP